MSIQSWNKAGFSYKNDASIANALSVHAVTADTTNSPESFKFPSACEIETVEVYFTALSAAGLSCVLFLARDSLGNFGITPGTTTGSTQVVQQSIGGGTPDAAIGSVSYKIKSDFHHDSGVPNSADGTIYVCLRLIGGTGTADIRVNWRA